MKKIFYVVAWALFGVIVGFCVSELRPVNAATGTELPSIFRSGNVVQDLLIGNKVEIEVVDGLWFKVRNEASETWIYAPAGVGWSEVPKVEPNNTNK